MTIVFHDYICITYSDVLRIDKNGIAYRGGYTDFKECAVNYRAVHGDSSNCVGNRDLTAMCFDFYTTPQITCIVFSGENWLHSVPFSKATVAIDRLRFILQEIFSEYRVGACRVKSDRLFL